jgi:DNA-binding MarR family transcriptional regulator
VDRKLRASEARVVAHVESYPDHCFALGDLLADLNMPEKTLKNCLSCLVRDGYISRPRRGFYGPSQ